jgi:hypothetical protein
MIKGNIFSSIIGLSRNAIVASFEERDRYQMRETQQVQLFFK